MKCVSLLVSIAMAGPAACLADVTAVYKLRQDLPNGDWHEVYVRSTQPTQEAADALARSACNAERRRAHAGSVLPDRSRCAAATDADFALAQRAAAGPIASAKAPDIGTVSEAERQ
jgi:hypothetical protein